MRGLTLRDPAIVGSAVGLISLAPSLWLRAGGNYWTSDARSTPSVTDGAVVGCWDDASGNGRNFTTIGSDAPTKAPILKTGANGLNGWPVVRSDGSDDYLTGTLDAQAAQTFFIVAKKNSVASSTTKTLVSWDTAFDLHTDTDEGAGYVCAPNQAAGATSVGGAAASWQIIALTFASNSLVTVRINGSNQVPLDPDNAYTSVTAMRLFMKNDGTKATDHDVAEVFRVSRALTLAEQDLVGAYLANKFGLTWLQIAAFAPLSLGPSIWLPSDGTYWQDSTRTTPATADAHPIGAWDDVSGNARHVLQATSGNRPVLKIGANGLNGRSLLRTDGSVTRISATIDAAAASTLFIVAKKNSAAIADDDVLLSLDDGGANALIDVDTAIGAGYTWIRNEAGGFPSFGGTVTNWNILVITVASASSMALRLNGGAAVATLDPKVEVTTGTKLTLGAGASTGSNQGDFDIAEVFRVTSALSLTNHDLIGNYLANRFALPWTVAA